jgi:ATP-dependent protease HslVU (ClpYQ) peptidase subunit
LTIVAYKDGVLAGDKLNVHGSRYAMITKIRKINGELIGIAGPTILATLLFEWIEKHKFQADLFPEGQKEKDGNICTVIRITKDKKIFIYENSSTPWLCENEFYALGSGCEYAMGAMAAGATAKEAVEICGKWAPLCGVGTDVVTFDSTTKRRKG